MKGIYVFVFGLALCIFAGSVLSQDGFLLSVDCDTILNCTEWDPVCASDKVTYDSSCHIHLENQNRYCIVGDFEQIKEIYKGNCTEDGSQ